MPRLAQVATARQAQLQDGRRLGFAQFGDADGKAIIFFHDLWGNRNLRHPDDSILARLGIRLIGVDRPGYGMSTRKSGRGLMDVVDDVMLLSKALKLDKLFRPGLLRWWTLCAGLRLPLPPDCDALRRRLAPAANGS